MPKLNKAARERIEILQDVLARLNAKKFKVKANCGYVVPDDDEAFEKLVQSKAKSETIANKLAKTCQVCAKGAIFLSTVSLKNAFDFKESAGLAGHVGPVKIMSRLSEIFDRDNLDLVETAFETPFNEDEQLCACNSCGVVDWDDFETAERFGSYYEEDDDRLRAILENMIANEGVFKPSAAFFRPPVR